MNDEGEWFAPKRYGLGATPSSWQGWALLVGFIGLAAIVGFLIPRIGWLAYASIMTMLTVTFIVIVARKTKGGMRWRWGKEE